AARRILGVGPVEAGTEFWPAEYGCYLPDKVTPYPANQLPLVRALSGETVAEEELYIRNDNRSDGLWICISGEPLSDGSGARRGGIVVFRDVSERRRAEEAMRDSHDELERHVLERTKELAQSNNELTQKNQENEMFVYSVSHDLRSPLVNLEGFSKELKEAAREIKVLLMDDQIPLGIREKATDLLENDVNLSLRFIQISVLRLGNIIEALLRLSRIGSVEYQCQLIDLQFEVARLIESMSVVLFDSGASVHVHDLPPCYGDSTAVSQLFANLIMNAVNYRDPTRSCVIEIGFVDDDRDSKDRFRTYYVKDNGLGIPPAHQEKIFQAFKRAHPKVAEGEGIGLTIVRRTVERHSGSVRVESQVGQGSTFFVTLPFRNLTHTSTTFEPDDSQYIIQGQAR
ncbi:MAG TPA: ATP-binding protein, partial [Pirellula sp.]|nr:ATP-binding protein [Pirellula sp.]